MLEDSENSWSYVIVTDGREPLIERLIQSIEREHPIDQVEVVIVGPSHFRLSRSFQIPCRLVVFEDDESLPGWITRKKNLGVYFSKYENVAVCHDYIELDPGYYDGLLQMDPHWTVGTCKVFFKDGRRSRDWITVDFPGVGQALLPYDKNYSQFQYLNGTFFFTKKSFFLKNPLDERRRWGQAEDVEWSMRVRKKVAFTLNPYSSIHFNRDKALDEPPYSSSWQQATARLHMLLGIHSKS